MSTPIRDAAWTAPYLSPGLTWGELTATQRAGVEAIERGHGEAKANVEAKQKLESLARYELLRRKVKTAADQLEEEQQPQSSLEFTRAIDITARKLNWVWHARLARGAISLLEGPPEKGKSTLLCDLAARITKGESMPGETSGREPANVVMLVAEDALDVTVVPRLVAAGADLGRIDFLTVTRDEKGQIVPFHLSDDCDRLREKCREVDALFVVVDPLVSYLGSRRGKTLNTGNDLEVRKALAPLKELAEQLDAVVVAIRHYRKGKGTDALEAGGGSIAFTALVRVILAALPDPNDANRYLFAVAKNNLVDRKKRPALAYQIASCEQDPDTSRIVWGDAIHMSAGEILEAAAEKAKDKETGAGAKARAFLRECLVTGDWVPAAEVFGKAEQQGISEKTLKRAKAKLGVETRKRQERWHWRLSPVDLSTQFGAGQSGGEESGNE